MDSDMNRMMLPNNNGTIKDKDKIRVKDSTSRQLHRIRILIPHLHRLVIRLSIIMRMEGSEHSRRDLRLRLDRLPLLISLCRGREVLMDWM